MTSRLQTTSLEHTLLISCKPSQDHTWNWHHEKSGLQGRICPAALAQAALLQQGISYRISKEPDIRKSRYCPDIGHDTLVFATRHPYHIPISGVKIDPDIEEKPDICAISGWQRRSNLNIVPYIEGDFFDIGCLDPISGLYRVGKEGQI